MCGIVGIFDPVRKLPKNHDLLRKMRDQMQHRGPDDAGSWFSRQNDCALGHRRLSIIDLSPEAAQPMRNEEGTVIITFNGEIYNHAEIRNELEALGKYHWQTDHSDTEVILHAFEEWGLKCLERFYGMFAFCIYDGRNPEKPILHLARDRVGIKPIYISRTPLGEWLFASEIKALLVHPDVTKEMDLTAFWHYLTFIVAPAPLTMFRNIFKIPAGYCVTIDHQGSARAHQYWDCKPDAHDIMNISEADAIRELTSVLKKSVERRMVSDVPFGVLLSGGVDSSMNVALMSELMDRPVTTFSIGYEGEERYNEFNFAREVSRQYKTDHHERLISLKEAQDFIPLLVELQDEPIADNVCIPLYFLAQLVKDCGTTVVQVGEGADENFLGYWWCDHYRKLAEKVYEPAKANKTIPWWRKIISRNRSAIPGLQSAEEAATHKRAISGQELFWGGAVCWWGEMRDQLTPDSAPFVQDISCPVEGLLPDGFSGLESHDIVSSYLSSLDGRLASPAVLQQIPYMEHKLRLPEHLLMRVDKMTMAHSIEARLPFLDHDVVEFAKRLPPSLKLKSGTGKYLLKKVAEQYLPKKIIYRKKQGFGAPMEEWFKQGDFGDKCKSSFLDSPLCTEGLIDKDYFIGMLSNQMGSGGGYSFHLWTVMNAVFWYDRWLK